MLVAGTMILVLLTVLVPAPQCIQCSWSPRRGVWGALGCPGTAGVSLSSAPVLELLAFDRNQLTVDKGTRWKLFKGAKINVSINIFIPNFPSHCCRWFLALEIPLALFKLVLI